MKLLILILLCCSIGTNALAAKPSGLDKPSAKPELFKLQNPVEQAQELLSQQGLYKGKKDGIRTPELEKAIKAYQRTHDLKETGKITSELLAHMENIGRVRALIKRLDVVRKERQEKARLALLSDPRTRKLLEQKETEVADPTRDASQCFAAPSSRCLLHEAVESSRAVFEDDLRDWALGEILSAQVSSGMEEAAMETAARIKDSRLVIAALTNIAKTHAKERKISEALSGLSLIPVAQRRLSVLLEIARIYRDDDQKKELIEVINRILAGTQSIEELEDRLSLQIQAAEILSFGDKDRALKLLDEISDQARKSATNGSKVTLLRQAASAMANVGYPEWALKALDELPDDETRIPVLMSSVRAFLKDGRFQAARSTLERISAPRYRSVILADLSKSLWQAQERQKSMEALAEAQTLANSIKLPFAKNYTLSKIAETLIEIASQSGKSIQADQAYVVLNKIKDGRLKARGLWNLANAARQKGFVVTKGDLGEETELAMNAIKSKFSKAWILGDLAHHHFASGEKEQAQRALDLGLKTVQNLKNPWARSRALAKFGAVINRLD
ncbi:peptidoglycan-binding domain-containing protein [Terasakiella sp. A23]|uniref:peptidoglycan-binding domain-containing protein n=1 Tax=Terasakiella sp. FCG-A23 TaxID=3080561 RepID=UPI0029551A7A|nr:peptidoglycan-binding domain-containing protein [Terasakiella sp. A23]MDV7339700.1 peptidoglycan-binding domain-containing protein [Terasakiella sp. A23]